MFRFMGDVAAKILPNDYVPGGAMSAIGLFFNLSGDIFFDVEFLQGSGCDIDSLLLQLLAHVNILYDGLRPCSGAAIAGRSARIDSER